MDRCWVVGIGLVAFGFLAALSVGPPFLIVGLTLIVLRPLRGRPVLFWPPLAAVIAWNVGFMAIAPFQCTASAVVAGPAATDVSMTSCSSLVGVTYVGPGVYNPSLEPADQAALLLGVTAFVVTLAATLVLRRQGQRGKAA